MYKQNKNIDREFVFKALTIVACSLIVIYFSQILNILKSILRISFPIILGLVIAYMVNLVLKSLESKFFPNSKSKIVDKLRRPVCLLLSFVIIIAIIYIILRLIIPQINDSILIITDGIPKLAEEIKNWFLKVTEGVNWTSEYRNRIENAQVNWSDIVSNAVNIIKSSVDGILGSTFNILNSLFGILFTGLTAIIFTITFLSSKETVSRQVKKFLNAYFSEKQVSKINYVTSVLDEKYSSFIKGKIIDSLIIGLLMFGVMLIFRFPYASTISIVTMVTSIIPIVGSYIGGAIGFLMIAAVDIQKALIFLIVFAITLQLESSIIYPKITGKSIGLPGIWVFAAVIIGGALAGPLGMIFGVPLVASAYTFIKNDIDNKRISKKESD